MKPATYDRFVRVLAAFPEPVHLPVLRGLVFVGKTAKWAYAVAAAVILAGVAVGYGAGVVILSLGASLIGCMFYAFVVAGTIGLLWLGVRTLLG